MEVTLYFKKKSMKDMEERIEEFRLINYEEIPLGWFDLDLIDTLSAMGFTVREKSSWYELTNFQEDVEVANHEILAVSCLNCLKEYLYGSYSINGKEYTL